MRSGPADPPFVPIYFGAAGIAYAICRLARSRGEYQLLALASAWVQKAFALSSDAKAYYDPTRGSRPRRSGRFRSFIRFLACIVWTRSSAWALATQAERLERSRHS